MKIIYMSSKNFLLYFNYLLLKLNKIFLIPIIPFVLTEMNCSVSEQSGQICY